MPPELAEMLNPIMAILMGLGLFGLILSGLAAIRYFWDQADEDKRDKITNVLVFVFGPKVDPVDALGLLLFANLLAGGVLFMIGLTIPSILILLGLSIAFPVFMFYRAAGQLSRELELALPLALQQVANEMAAGATLETALKKVAKTAPPPADIEIARLQRRVEVMGIDEAFTEMARRLNSRSFTLTASVVRVGTSSGGRLIEALKSLSRTLIEIERLNKKIRTASENGRRNILLLSLLGPVVAIGSAFVVDHETSIFEDNTGQLLVGISVLMFFAAHVIGYFMTKVKV